MKQSERLTKHKVFPPNPYVLFIEGGGNFMNSLIRKIALEGLRAGKRISEIDMSNPLTQDTASFIIDVLKEVIKPF
ncbi:hypothetical protein [Thermaerobacillus caldiproteolyticus]|uniref:hypothetical protein n=1 Tax=Thermaerobacillus caldiproteolyticus TaxID=247480 RepID=UPI00188D6833|nr:hypothetical protein [Anoxybacillus caldiproteolyticus]QPA33383.1 hypothetical protein ISX45_19220 [Anoxybacillus caldiproteolyticus]